VSLDDSSAPSNSVIFVDRPEPIRRLKLSSSRPLVVARGFLRGLPMRVPSSDSTVTLPVSAGATVEAGGGGAAVVVL
jgi:hypothetical protein